MLVNKPHKNSIFESLFGVTTKNSVEQIPSKLSSWSGNQTLGFPGFNFEKRITFFFSLNLVLLIEDPISKVGSPPSSNAGIL